MRKNAAAGSSGDALDTVALWRAIEPFVDVGALFRVPDVLVNPSTGSVDTHPYVIVGRATSVHEAARVALSRPVQLSCRSSFKVDQHGPVPTTPHEEFVLAQKSGLIFSPADPQLGLNLNGVFLVPQFTILTRDLVGTEFLGWLPREVIDTILYRRNLRPTSGAYPPRRAV